MINLDSYRKNSKNVLRNIRIVQRIRKNRERFLYNPLTVADTQV